MFLVKAFTSNSHRFDWFLEVRVRSMLPASRLIYACHSIISFNPNSTAMSLNLMLLLCLRLNNVHIRKYFNISMLKLQHIKIATNYFNMRMYLTHSYSCLKAEAPSTPFEGVRGLI